MISVFLQVRLDSSRLPRKALRVLGDRTVVEHCFRALSAVSADQRVLVTESASEPELAPLARAAGWTVFAGSKTNVLDRFVRAARLTGTTTIVRATGDNPLVSAALANKLLAVYQEAGADYSGFQGAPTGTGVEIVRVAALETAWSSRPDAYESEHVCPYLYRRPEQFKILQPEVEATFRAPTARVTLDTPDDFLYLSRLWEELYHGTPLETEALIPWLNRNPR